VKFASDAGRRVVDVAQVNRGVHLLGRGANASTTSSAAILECSDPAHAAFVGSDKPASSGNALDS
jgi:hypothetical protein